MKTRKVISEKGLDAVGLLMGGAWKF